MNHEVLDRVSAELARRVASRLRRNPALVELARSNLERWSRLNSEAPSLLRSYGEWRRLLDLPVEDICRLLESDTEEATRLRQNSPFAGVLSPEEVWSVKANIRG